MAAETIVKNPATGEVIGSYPEISIAELNAVAQQARAVQQEWQNAGYDTRKKYLFKMREYIVLNADAIAEVISRATGKTLIDALSTEVFPAAVAFNYYARNAEKFLKPHRLFPSNIITANKVTKVVREPFGVVGIITPWNYPFGIPAHELAAALITGNTIIFKTDSQVLPVGELFVKAAQYAGLPEGVLNFVNIPVPAAGEAIINSGIDKLFFTGSVRVGKMLMGLAAEKLIPVSLELGGKDVMVVTPNADLERAVGGALWAGLSNAGQSCAGVERIFVHEKVHHQFVKLLRARLSSLSTGNSYRHTFDIGSLTTERQLATVKRHIDDAISKGASPLFALGPVDIGGKGFFFQPVLLEGVSEDMAVEKEETFGPVLTVTVYTDNAQPVAAVNSGEYGLTASVWTDDAQEKEFFTNTLKAGQITVNDHLLGHGLPEAPWGGYRHSGIGRTHGYLGLEEMTQAKAIITDLIPFFKRNLWWYPHNEGVYNALRGALHFLYHPNLSVRVSGIITLLKKLPRAFKVWGE